jgi:hypothetical protein
MWSTPRRITERLANSYRLETLDGAKLEGEFNARRLREFVPREGTDLAEAQKAHMEQVAEEEEKERREKEKEKVDNLRKMESEHNTAADYNITSTNRPEFFYEEDEETVEEEEEEAEDEGIVGRVVRRRGRRH